MFTQNTLALYNTLIRKGSKPVLYIFLTEGSFGFASICHHTHTNTPPHHPHTHTLFGPVKTTPDLKIVDTSM